MVNQEEKVISKVNDNKAITVKKSDVQEKGLLRLLTCGSVDDGKSTLIGRMLYNTNLIFEDQLTGLKKTSEKFGTTGEDIDFALLVDGLEAEQEQGITIDVAYRFFATDKRKFIIADTPGHQQYTRNMVTGASTADLAILMVDARKGLLEQSKRHAFIVSQLGIKNVVVAINKMDLVDFSEEVYESIVEDFSEFSKELNFTTVASVPISARFGDNITETSNTMPWYQGVSLLEYIETIDIIEDKQSECFHMPVQWVNRPNLDFRGFSGTVTSGSIKKGDKVEILPSKKKAIVNDIIVANSNLDAIESLDRAQNKDAITILLDQEIDISRGDVIVSPEHSLNVADQFAANIIWMAEKPLYAGRPYLLKMNGRTIVANVTEIKHKIDIETFSALSAKYVSLNEIAVCNLSTNEPIIFDSYEQNRAMGSFILIDRLTNATVGAGLIKFPLHRSSNIQREHMDINKESRSRLKSQKPVVLWFTGLSGSGKSTIANAVEQKLYDLGQHTYLLDGDNVRHGLNRDLGFTDADRVENIRRIGEVAKLMVDAGLITLVSFISPFRSERHQARSLMGKSEFVEIFVDTPLEICKERDVKGLYKRAIAGEIKNFTGVSSTYEVPQNSELRLETVESSPEDLAEQVIGYLRANGVL